MIFQNYLNHCIKVLKVLGTLDGTMDTRELKILWSLSII